MRPLDQRQADLKNYLTKSGADIVRTDILSDLISDQFRI